MDYDDGDPYSCIAAGYAERQAREWLPERMAKLKSEVHQCFGKPVEELNRLLDLDKSKVILVLGGYLLRVRIREHPALG